MQIKKIETKITTYQVIDNFFVEAQEILFDGEEVIEFWIYHKQYAIKWFMAERKKSDIPKDCFESVIMDSAESIAKEYMRDYYEEHMDYDERVEAEIEKYCNENP